MRRVQSFGPGSPGGDPPGGPGPRTAAAVHLGQVVHLGPHLERLVRGAAAMGEPAPWLPPSASALSAWVARTAPSGRGMLRLRLDAQRACLWASLEDLPATALPWRLAPLTHPLTLRREDPRLTHKGLMGLWGDEVLNQAHHLGASDALLLWADGTVAETAIASVGLERNGELCLPPPQGRVESLAERLDLPVWAQSRGLRIRVAAFRVEDAAEGRLWCLNAVRGCWPAVLL